MLTLIDPKKHILYTVSEKLTESKEDPTMKKLLALALTLCLLLGVRSIASAADTTTLTMWTFIAQHQEFF